MRYSYHLLLVLLSISILSSQAKSNYKIAVIPKSTNHVYWNYFYIGTRQAAQELNIKIIWTGPRKEGQSQVGYIRRLQKSNIDALIIAPGHHSKLVPTINKLISSGIKFIIIDSEMDNSNYTHLIATDNYQAGSQAGEYLSSLLNKKGRIMLLRYKQGNRSTQQREQGFLDTLKKYPSMEIVYDDYVGTSAGSAYHALFPIFKRASIIDGVFASNESSTIGLLRALKKTGFSGKVKTVGFDINDELVAALKTGELHGTMLQQPIKIGYLSVKQAYEALEKKLTKSKTLVKTVLVTHENINSKKIQSLLYINTKKVMANYSNTEDLLTKFFVLLRLIYQQSGQ
ncbi:substrate-binding domain-containing protein [Endozoicomonas sp. SM1973]|uniref:Substrate-binding domain-containing protein n=1 Tax=Spartinivicinus marinus TaxID=2994442 RepID=A0A853I607_9GAMM|nr:substrate-binding domain-containing protein [Spartinivicinus marinus]MCX4029320.1 substrate-binding domain-containing protein [Spartinivicinus marinus]NYZ68159.1 substrate-binding domain-containing protein [Spartinivicinus marinus]